MCGSNAPSVPQARPTESCVRLMDPEKGCVALGACVALGTSESPPNARPGCEGRESATSGRQSRHGVQRGRTSAPSGRPTRKRPETVAASWGREAWRDEARARGE